MSERFLAKAQVRKAASLVNYEMTKKTYSKETVLRDLISQFPAMRHTDQQNRVAVRAKSEMEREIARQKVVTLLVEHVMKSPQ